MTSRAASILTPRDEELLDVLAKRVRVLSLSQVARTWWPRGTEETTHGRLRRLALAGHLLLLNGVARPEVTLQAPLAAWQPGCSKPSMTPVVSAARSRWIHTLPGVTACVAASGASGIRFGGRGGRLPRTTEWTHDLHLAQVYLRMRSELPTRAASWRHEDLAPRTRESLAGEKLPDAIVTDGLHDTAIELVGLSYDQAKLDAFHGYCVASETAYELW